MLKAEHETVHHSFLPLPLLKVRIDFEVIWEYRWRFRSHWLASDLIPRLLEIFEKLKNFCCHFLKHQK